VRNLVSDGQFNKHDQECYGCGATGNSSNFGMGRSVSCPYCGSGEVHYSRSDDEDTQNRTEVIDKFVSSGHNIEDVTVNDSGHPQVTHEYKGWVGTYKGGGIDVAHSLSPDSAVGFINVNAAIANERERKQLGPQEVHEHLQNWVEENGDEYLRNL